MDWGSYPLSQFVGSSSDHESHIFGAWTADAAKGLIQEFFKTAQRSRRTSVFLDLQDLLPPAENYDRYLTSVQMAVVWGGNLKVNALAQTKYASGFTEKVAVNRTAN